MYVCSHLYKLSLTNIWLHTDLATPRELWVPILVPITLYLSNCENAKIGQPKIIVFGASKLKYTQLPGMKKTIFIGTKIFLFQYC